MHQHPVRTLLPRLVLMPRRRRERLRLEDGLIVRRRRGRSMRQHLAARLLPRERMVMEMMAGRGMMSRLVLNCWRYRGSFMFYYHYWVYA